MDSGQKRKIIRIILCSVILAVSMFTGHNNSVCFLLISICNWLIIGWDIAWEAVCNIIHGEIFDENFLMTLASTGAFIIGEYPEAVAIVLFYQLGELFEDIAVDKSKKSVSELMDIRPDFANTERNGNIIKTDPASVKTGEIIIVKAGERIPLDGVVISGTSTLDTSALTGESMPENVREGSEVVSGCINQKGLLKVKVTKEYKESTVAKILDLIENSSSKKADSEKFITRFSKIYTPVVVLSALILAVVPSVLFGDWTNWLHRALIFLVVSCPCALVISVPLSFFGGIGGAGKRGILIKGGNYLELLAKSETFVFDKTGTLTKGVFTVTEIHPENISEDKLIEYAAYAESYSTHPIALSLINAYKGKTDRTRISSYEEKSGYGVCAVVDGKKICVGNKKFMDMTEIECQRYKNFGTVVYISVDDIFCGYIVISDVIRENSSKLISKLRLFGISKIIMLTGDKREVSEKIAEKLNIDEVHAELLPADKVGYIDKLLSRRKQKDAVVFVGDGINDAPVLAQADIGIAMGGIGSDAAIEAADVVIMDDNPYKIALSIKIARKTVRIVRENIIFALTVKFLILLLSVVGISSSIWLAVFADVGVSVLAVLNALRCLYNDAE